MKQQVVLKIKHTFKLEHNLNFENKTMKGSILRFCPNHGVFSSALLGGTSHSNMNQLEFSDFWTG